MTQSKKKSVEQIFYTLEENKYYEIKYRINEKTEGITLKGYITDKKITLPDEEEKEIQNPSSVYSFVFGPNKAQRLFILHAENIVSFEELTLF